MLAYVLIGTLAAFGLMCAVWVLCGLCLPKKDPGQLVYRGKDALSFARRYLWLREMGLLRVTLWVCEPEETLIPWLKAQGIEVYSREEITRQGMGAEEN